MKSEPHHLFNYRQARPHVTAVLAAESGPGLTDPSSGTIAFDLPKQTPRSELLQPPKLKSLASQNSDPLAF